MITVKVMVSRHSAFYSPLIAGIAGGFFEAEGFAPTYAVAPTGRNVAQFIESGEADVVQSAVSASWMLLEKGQMPPLVHFAQINQRDGFLIAGRGKQRNFSFADLLKGDFMFVHGGQPQAMLAYALHLKGLDIADVQAANAGNTEKMMAAFRSGEGQWFHEQAPYPQQLEFEGHARIVASVGEVIGPVAFSSLAASPAWLEKKESRLFMRAYRMARHWVQRAPPEEVAGMEQRFFQAIDREALTSAIAFYQKLGCWAGTVTIERDHYETALDIFTHSKLITKRHRYEQVVVGAPED